MILPSSIQKKNNIKPVPRSIKLSMFQYFFNISNKTSLNLDFMLKKIAHPVFAMGNGKFKI